MKKVQNYTFKVQLVSEQSVDYILYSYEHTTYGPENGIYCGQYEDYAK